MPCPRVWGGLTHFASSQPLTAAELRAAPARYPSPARMAAPLQVGAGEKAREAAASLGLLTVGDLLEYLPRDQRETRTVAALGAGESATIIVEVRRIATRPVRRRGMRPLVEATVADASGTLLATFFNQPWLAGRYRPGTRLVLHGRADGHGRFSVQAHALTDEVAAGGAPAGAQAGVGHYPVTDGISSTQLLALVREHASACDDAIEPLPASLRRREGLLDRPGALRCVHFPLHDGAQEQGRRRLAFEELFLRAVALELGRRRRRLSVHAPVLDGARELTARWIAQQLPFALTTAQSQALEAIDADLASGAPMQRLLMGEVGSGKTVVALYALLRAVEHGFQAALMAPTETLAEQHFQTIQRLCGSEVVSAGLLTGSTPASRRAGLQRKLASGELALVVGTHALIEESVEFRRLAMVVIDEQHRFGVGQRAALAAPAPGGMVPHELHMTATPIPRTLALSHYGDLDVTELRELPRGRLAVATHVCDSDAERERAYARIRAEVDGGRQAFVVCPLVQESAALEARAASTEYERLRQGPLRGYEVVLIHGQMRAAQKQEAMARFTAGAAQVLVATTVIEVGVDVPNATVMLVEDADRYGISQLHQLRGRIGRGPHQSLCLLFGRRDSPRLRALARESDGFRLAEADLALRGEGELAGTRQSGRDGAHRFADLGRDQELLERAVLRARVLVDEDPGLSAPEHALIASVLPTIVA